METRDGTRCALGASAITLLLALGAPAAQALTPIAFSYAGPPVPIADGSDLSGNAPGAPASVTIPASGLGTRTADVDVRIDGTACSTAVGSTTVGIAHSFVNDLEITLTSPAGTVVKVVDNADGSGNNLCQVVLDDDSGMPSIQTAVTASAPFTGTWTPANPLSAFDDEDPNGDWTFTARDFFAADTGSIRAVSILVTSKATPTIAGASSPDVVVGGAVSLTATVTGRDSPAGDSVDFALYGPDDATCSQTPAFSATAVAIDGGGAASSGPFAPPAVGTYRWIATYSGDASNVGVSTPCGGPGQTVLVTKATPTIAGTSSPDVTVGGAIFDDALVSGRVSPSGDTVDFALYGPDDPTCGAAPIFTALGTAIDGAGAASSGAFTTTAPGTYRWIATYSGDASNAGASTACGVGGQTVVVRLAPRATTTITATSSANTAPNGAVADTAKVSGRVNPTPGDTVVFRAYGPDDTTCSRAPAFTSPAIPVDGQGTAYSGAFRPSAPGGYRWTAAYSGDARNLPSSTPCGAGGQSFTVREVVVCRSQRQLKVRLIRRPGLLRDLRGARIVAATLTPVSGGSAVKQRFTARAVRVDMRGLTRNTYRLRVRIKPRKGRTFTFVRTYRVCQ